MADQNKMLTLSMMSCGAFFGAAHAWAKQGLDAFIAQRVKLSMENGELAQAGVTTVEEYEHAFLREAIYMIHAIFKSLPHDVKGGLDAIRMASDQQAAGSPGQPPVIPPFRSLMADFLGVPNPFEPKPIEPQPADQGGGSAPQLPSSNPEQTGDGS